MKSKTNWFLLAAILVFGISGCYRVAQDKTTFHRYYQTSLNLSTSSDVISMISAEGELTSQGENAVVSYGETKKGRAIWFNMVAFDDESSNAIRKYAFVTNPRAWGVWKYRAQTLRLDAELVVDPKVLSEPYTDNNAKKIAVLKSVLAEFTADINPLVKESKVLRSNSLMVKQLLKGIIQTLEASPALAVNLEDYSGMTFDHMTLDKGKIRMIINDGVVSLKAMTGSAVKDFDKRLDVVGM